MNSFLKFIVIVFLLFSVRSVKAQVTCSATSNSGSGYDVIKDAGFAIETPDCGHERFGPHITQDYDEELKKNVFVFHSHIDEDSDRCKNHDRVRIEIKGGPGSSSSTLEHPRKETSFYRWKFKLDDDFKGSSNFCHIFQMKAKKGDDNMPIITLTPRKSTIEIIHDGGDSGSDLGDLKETSLSEFKGVWVEAHVKATYDEDGYLEFTLKSVETGKTLLSYKNSDIDLWRKGAIYVRPKWGVYRKKSSELKDEQVRFTDWCISESKAKCW